ncbi:hypothetical protein GGI35DRAFT_455103 [Trichoderma velutinum]
MNEETANGRDITVVGYSLGGCLAMRTLKHYAEENNPDGRIPSYMPSVLLVWTQQLQQSSQNSLRVTTLSCIHIGTLTT